MLRRALTCRRHLPTRPLCRRLLSHQRYLSSDSVARGGPPAPQKHSSPSLLNPDRTASSLPLSPLPPSLPPRRRLSYLLASGTLISAIAASALLFNLPPAGDDAGPGKRSDKLSAEVQEALRRSQDSCRRVVSSMKQTGAAGAVLWRSLSSVLSSANHEVQKGFELRVAALIADIASASEARRAALVAAGRGMVVDWLLETVAVSPGKVRDHYGTQAESARALAYLISDPNVCEAVLARPHAVPSLLRFIFSFQPKRAKKHKHSSLDGPDVFKGRSMLVAAIMDIITSNCDKTDRASFRPSLPAKADMGDIAAALEVIEVGGIHFSEHPSDDDEDDGDRGMRGIGIKVLGGTTVLGFSRTDDLLLLKHSEDDLPEHVKEPPSSSLWQKNHTVSSKVDHLASAPVPGLWDDLRREHVAVPFAAWALANWALASELNRSYILELDRDGLAIMSALTAPERTVKWHGSLVAQVLLEDQNLPLTDSVPDWSFSLLSTVSQASRGNDIALAQAALSAFFVSVKRSYDAKMMVMDKGLHLMRETAKRTEKHKTMQESLARALEVLCMSDRHLSLEESQKWAGILLRWIFNKASSNMTRSSAIKILSFILEDYGPASIPISQGWLTILLTEILGDVKTAKMKGNPLVKTDKVKTQIDESNALSASQVASQLASAVVNLAGSQSQQESDSNDTFPLADFLLLEPFAAVHKNFNKDRLRKFDAADSAFNTLKGIKALTELCSEDSSCQKKIVDFGVLCLVRRFLLSDDYEKLAAIETYDASRGLESQERDSAVTGSAQDANDPSSIRVPPSAHIRKHAARLLMVLSLLPDVKQAIIADQALCQWLEDCSTGRIPCCNDLKIQSYARATLMNVFCSEKMDKSANKDDHPGIDTERRNKCPQFSDMLFLINPELPHWKCSGKGDGESSDHGSVGEGRSATSNVNSSYNSELTKCEDVSSANSTNAPDKHVDPEAPLMDIVFIHGMRGGPFKSWRIADNKSSTTSKSGLVENIDQEAGKQGTCWPREWLSSDLSQARLFTVKYKTNLSQWTGASLPLQEVSSMLLQKLVAAGIGDRPVVFVTHSMGGLVVKQMLYEAKTNDFYKFVDNTVGVVFYSCPHFGSKLADMPWRMGLVLRPAPTIGELRSGSPRLMELNDFLRQRYNKGFLKILSFSETLVTPIVEGYGGWAFRMEVVPIESAYPGFGDIIVLDGTDHINSCKPVSRTDPSYAKTLEFLEKLKANLT